ncbi:adenine(58)-N(1)-methyltransferase non-catalytic subunit TRM6 [Paraphysoderma sedebokerense]|nr:adenine(58)-N(1)-methyltransferase non-catalytic subunit TRM6 [Paraphysoderma sedebokerense]
MQDVIQEGKFVIIIMPSGNKKIVQVKADSVIELGKFGKFSANLIIGKPFGPTYEIINHNEIKRIELKSELEEVEETEANNQAIYDIMTNQKLTHDEIEELKEKSLKGEVRGDDIIKRIIDNHDQFSKKTEYSKAKYKKRKEQRFLRTFTPVQVNMRSICEYFFEKSILKIRELRIDTLSIMLSQANIRAGSKVLVVDDVQGLLVAAVMERLGGHGTVVAIHESEQHNYDIVRYMNFSDNVLDTLHTLSFARAFPIETGNEDELMEKMNQEQRNFYEKKKASYERSLKVRDLLLAGEFDG